MDIRDTFKTHMNYIVGCFFNNVGGSEVKLMDEMYKMIENDISINFDSQHFYLLKYELIDDNKLYFDIDCNNTPNDLLKMIINLIEHRRMEQNIKNKKYLIHFRIFKGKVYLEDKTNTLRIEAYLQLHNYIHNPFTTIRIDLVNRLLKLNNKLKNEAELDEDTIIQYKIQAYRVKAILRAIEGRTTQLS